MSKEAFFGLLSGLAQRLYYGNSEVTDALLKNELYPSLSDEQFSKLVSKATTVLKTLAASNMDWTQLEAFLTSQTKRQEGGLTGEQAECTSRFWRNHRARVRASVVAQSRWNPGLESCSWRVDLEGPTAQVSLGELQFQMGKPELESLLGSIAAVQVALDKHCPRAK
ncbi:hypothetical protein MTO96_014499 [Rhipicephalus appendiculatus]|uniref:COMM domain containing protein n=1 Tax=Rhipicephalus appendiculatus TaxID=34631 RepID=A0A131YHQ6_RHIAP